MAIFVTVFPIMIFLLSFSAEKPKIKRGRLNCIFKEPLYVKKSKCQEIILGLRLFENVLTLSLMIKSFSFFLPLNPVCIYIHFVNFIFQRTKSFRPARSRIPMEVYVYMSIQKSSILLHQLYLLHT